MTAPLDVRRVSALAKRPAGGSVPVGPGRARRVSALVKRPDGGCVPVGPGRARRVSALAKRPAGGAVPVGPGRARRVSAALLPWLLACSPALVQDAGAGPDADAGVDADGGTWTRLAELPRAQQECGVAAVGAHVYVVGGFSLAGQLLADVVRLDVSQGRWQAVQPLPRPLHHANVASLGGRLYVVGALEGGGFTARGDTLEYDPSADVWTARAPLPAGTERGGSAVGVLDGALVIAGGYRAGRAVTDVTAFDPATNQHRALPPLPFASEHVVGGVVGRRLYVVGGRDGAIGSITGRVQIYDAATGAWQQGPDLPTPRGGHAAAVVGSRLVVIGGEGNRAVSSGVFGEVEVLDTGAAVWTRAASMPSPRHGTGAAAVGDLVIVPGGAAVEGLGPVRLVEAFRL